MRLSFALPIVLAVSSLSASADPNLTVRSLVPPWIRPMGIPAPVAPGLPLAGPGARGPSVDPGDERVSVASGSTTGDGAWIDAFPPQGRGSHAMVYDPIRDRLVAIGGWTGEPSNEVWACALSGIPTWTRLQPSGPSPEGRHGHTAIYDPPRDRIVVFGGEGSGGGLLNDVWALSLSGTPTWTQLSPAGDRPIVRYYHAAIYDPVRNRMIVYGGFHSYVSVNDVWSLNLSGSPVWTRLTSGPGTWNRSGHAAAYDPIRDRMLVLGGWGSPTSLDELWALSLTSPQTWSLLPQGGTIPTARAHHTVIYDPLRDRLLMFGGNDGYSTFRDNEVWALALAGGATWSHVESLRPSPSPRVGHAAVYDPLRDRMLVFGGFSRTTILNELWSFTLTLGTSWTVLSPPGGAPSATFRPSAVYEPDRERMVVYRGEDQDGSSSTTWSLSLASPAWTELHPDGVKPPARYGDSAVYDPLRHRILIFGGSWAGYLNDLWELSLEPSLSWRELTPSGNAPAPRYYHTSTYDPIRDRVLVVGGFDGSRLYEDTWQLWLTDPPVWQPLAALPESLGGHTSVYDPVRDRLLVFGGWNGRRYIDTVWELPLAEPAQWKRLVTTGTPPRERTGHTAIYDPTLDRMLVFAGYDSLRLSDLWSLNLEGAPQWVRLNPPAPGPPARASHAAVFDPVRDRMVVFGGGNESRNYNDVWFLQFDFPVPALVSLVSADATSDRVEMVWYGAGLLGGTVERRDEDTEWRMLARARADGTGSIRYEDRAVTPGNRYAYRLIYHSDVGEVSTREHWVVVPVPRFALFGFCPNPASGAAAVAFSLSSGQPVAIEVFDLLGRRVISQTAHGFGPGEHTLELEGHATLEPGVYLLRMSQTGRTAVARGLIIR